METTGRILADCEVQKVNFGFKESMEYLTLRPISKRSPKPEKESFERNIRSGLKSGTRGNP